MTLFFERFLELLLRKNNIDLTPDKIRHALSGVHTMFFEDTNSNKEGKMESALSAEAEKIFTTLNISPKRFVVMTSCCA